MFGGLPGSKQKIGQSFPPGTTLLFWQAAAPIGWTKITTQNDALLRVVSGVGGPHGGGGSNAFSAVNAQTVVGSTTLSQAQMPSHTHTSLAAGGGSDYAGGSNYQSVYGNTGYAGGGGSHNHAIAMSILYVDVILASKN